MRRRRGRSRERAFVATIAARERVDLATSDTEL